MPFLEGSAGEYRFQRAHYTHTMDKYKAHLPTVRPQTFYSILYMRMEVQVSSGALSVSVARDHANSH